MARLTSEGKVKAYYLPVVASKAAPTVAEITAGTNLTPQLPTDGLDISPTNNNASQAMLDDAFVAEEPGTFSYGATATFTRDPDTVTTGAGDDVWTLITRDLRGFLLISRFGAPVAGNKVEVYPIACHAPAPLAPAENAYQKFRVQFAVTAAPELNATVAA